MSSTDTLQSTRSNAFNAAYSLVPIEYSVTGGSEHSGRYEASNIKYDRPLDQYSRWSGLHHDRNPKPKQWLLLELECVSVLYTITFGKFHKVHPCNLKEFKIFVGLTKDHMTEVLHANLKNDAVPETFLVRNTSQDFVQMPIRYVKLIAISAHGVNYNISIWHVALAGIKDPSMVKEIVEKYDVYRETVAMRQIMKHLRQRRHISTYRKLLSQTGVELEHPLVSQLHESLVLRGDWPLVERILRAISDAGLFDYHIKSSRPQAIWTKLTGVDANGDIPSKRGGHAMCMDVDRSLIYVFGGYDGQKSLDDFWMYDVRAERWLLISPNASEEKNGPGPRACHKMVFDPKSGSIYLLGRLGDGDFPPQPANTDVANPQQQPTAAPAVENQNTRSATPANPNPAPRSVSVRVLSEEEYLRETSARASSTPSAPEPLRPQIQNFCSEFYRYRTRGLDQGKWELISFDTTTAGGPPLMYDHQMVIDSEAQTIYVYGGRIVDGDWEAVKYSGLYSYDIRASKWTLLPIISPNDDTIPPRFGHSMVFDPKDKTLFIFSGRQVEKYLTDMWSYDVKTNLATEISSNFTVAGGPEGCFTQRSVIDPDIKEIYILDGTTKNDTRVNSPMKAAVYLYRYDKTPGQWIHVLPYSQDSLKSGEIPQSRWAHQVAYDSRSKTFYMHGGKTGVLAGVPHDGNEGRVPANIESRLDDLWSMTLRRLPRDEVVRRATLIIRQQQYKETAEDISPVRALTFLQTELSAVVDHSNTEEVTNFRTLLNLLVAPSPANVTTYPMQTYYGPSPNPTPASTPSDEDPQWTNELPNDGTKQIANVKLIGIDSQSAESINVEENSSAERFRERTEVFEKLLEFLAPEVKQPQESLLDMLDISEYFQ